jgi:uncharacterized delta-60 repeat protein
MSTIRVDKIMPFQSSSVEILGSFNGTYTGSFTGSFVGDGSGLTGITAETSIETSSFATTGSNTFVGDQTIQGTLTASIQEGYVLVGGVGDVSTLAATSSFGGGGSTFPYTGDAVISGSLTITGSLNFSQPSTNITASITEYSGGISLNAESTADGAYAQLYWNGLPGTGNPIEGSNKYSVAYVSDDGFTVQYKNTTNFQDSIWRFRTDGDLSVPGNITGAGNLATTGSNTFVGNQVITGSVLVSGSINSDGYELDGSTTTTIPVLNSIFNLDLSGSGEYGGDNFIKKTLVLGDGKVLIAGRFQSIDGHTTNDIARLNSNGTIDTSFTSPGFGDDFVGEYYGYINTFVTQSDNKILVGGNFTEVNGDSNRLGLARLNSDGTLDNSFTSQSWGSFGEVHDIAIQNDGKIVCVGYFTSGSRRINTDGTLDTSFNVSTGSNQPEFFNNDYFHSVALLTSGSGQAILIGGSFQQWGSLSDYGFLVKLHPSGALDSGFAGTNLDITTGNSLDRIQKIKVGDDGYIYVAGRFRDTGIGNNAGFARITTTDEGNGVGAINTGFRTYISGSFVNDFDFYDGDKILLGGNFTLFGNPAFSVTSANRFAIIRQSTGGLVTNWSTDGLASKYNLNTGSVSSVILLPSDNVLVGGTFTSASFPSTAREGLASLKLTGYGDVTTTSEYNITADSTRLLVSSSNTQFSGDVNIVGNITASVISGSFVGDGSGLIGIDLPSGVVSGSAQVLDGTGILSSSVTNFTEYSQSVDTRIDSIVSGIGFATTGSNTFVGTQIVSASVDVSGSVTADVFQIGTPPTYSENTAYWLYGNFSNAGSISFGFSSGNSIANIDNVYINETSSDLNGAAIVNSLAWINGLVSGSVITIQGIDSSPSNLNQTIVLSVNSITDFSGAWGIGVSVVSSTPEAAPVNGSLYSLTYTTTAGDGSYTITGDETRLLVSSSNTEFNGFVVLSQVSSSYDFADDTAAASGGVPLGGLYHTSGSVKIRLV